MHPGAAVGEGLGEGGRRPRSLVVAEEDGPAQRGGTRPQGVDGLQDVEDRWTVRKTASGGPCTGGDDDIVETVQTSARQQVGAVTRSPSRTSTVLPASSRTRSSTISPSRSRPGTEAATAIWPPSREPASASVTSW
ncbi:hypothetical protein DDE05_52060, partial [Streptomyces cavourensis]